MLKSAEHLNLSTSGHRITLLLAYPLIFVIYLYRNTLSSVFGNNCRYYPSCSQYAEDALKKYGAFQGSIYALKRVLRCHPWHDGGYDPIE